MDSYMLVIIDNAHNPRLITHWKLYPHYPPTPSDIHVQFLFRYAIEIIPCFILTSSIYIDILYVFVL